MHSKGRFLLLVLGAVVRVRDAAVVPTGSTVGPDYSRAEGLGIPLTCSCSLPKSTFYSRHRMSRLASVRLRRRKEVLQGESEAGHWRNRYGNRLYFVLGYNVYYPDCDGGLTDVYSQCCPSDAVDCNPQNSAARCRSHSAEGNIKFFFLSQPNTYSLGQLCPNTNPFAYKGGAFCCGDAHKEKSATAGCDGDLIGVDNSECCASGQAVPCRSSDSSKKCKNNPHYGEKFSSWHRFNNI